jgi:pimeloyl-ACP methyl ester carboxylesterase
MPYLNNNGVKLYYEVVGEGVPIIMHHGGGGCIQNFFDAGYVGHLKEHFKVVLFDMRGHGKSDKPHNIESYQPQVVASDTVAVLEHLGIEKAICFGYSLGGRASIANLKYFPQYFNGFVIGGAPPYPLERMRPFFDKLYSTTMEDVVSSIESKIGSFPAVARKTFLDNDIIAMKCSFELVYADLTDAIDNLKVPCLFYAGEKDTAVENIIKCAQAISVAEFELRIIERKTHFDLWHYGGKETAEMIVNKFAS